MSAYCIDRARGCLAACPHLTGEGGFCTDPLRTRSDDPCARLARDVHVAEIRRSIQTLVGRGRPSEVGQEAVRAAMDSLDALQALPVAVPPQTPPLPRFSSVGSEAVFFRAVAEVATEVDRFVELTSSFFRRAIYDCRLPSSGRPFNTLHPLYRKLACGTREEREKGFFVSMDLEEDETEFSRLRPYAMSTDVYSDALLPEPGACRVKDLTFDVDPRALVYPILTEALGLQPCERIFILQGHPSAERALFCFPLACRFDTGLDAEHERRGAYLMVSIGGRYSEREAFLFHGDPVEHARRFPRQPRDRAEVDRFKSGERLVDEAPARLAMTWSSSTGAYVDPQPVTLPDLRKNAIAALQAGKWLRGA